MEDLTISVAIADRPYRLTIKRSEEEIIRKAADDINKNLKYYSDNFAYNDRQDLLAMVALEKTTNALIHKHDSIESDRLVMARLTEIDKTISECLVKD